MEGWTRMSFKCYEQNWNPKKVHMLQLNISFMPDVRFSVTKITPAPSPFCSHNCTVLESLPV